MKKKKLETSSDEWSQILSESAMKAIRQQAEKQALAMNEILEALEYCGITDVVNKPDRIEFKHKNRDYILVYNGSFCSLYRLMRYNNNYKQKITCVRHYRKSGDIQVTYFDVAIQVLQAGGII